MKVLSIIHYPVFGGPHNRNSKLIPVLNERGIETIVLLPNGKGNAHDRLNEAGINSIVIPLSRLRATKNIFKHMVYVVHFIFDVYRIYKLIKSNSIDLIQINGFINLQGAFAAKLAGKPVVLQIIDTYTPHYARRLLMPLVKGTVDVLMSTGERVARLHPGTDSYQPNIVYFNPPVDLALFKSDEKTKFSARLKLGLEKDDIVIGNVGNLNKQKGHDLFIQAAILLKRILPSCKFVILGARYLNQKEYIEKLYELAESSGLVIDVDIFFVNPSSQVHELEPAFDVFWMTSRPDSEGIPTSIQEAMALGIPVISTNVGSISEVVINDCTGYIVEPFDASSIVNRTQYLLENIELYEEMSSNCVEFAQNNFSILRCVCKHEQAYEIALRTIE